MLYPHNRLTGPFSSAYPLSRRAPPERAKHRPPELARTLFPGPGTNAQRCASLSSCQTSRVTSFGTAPRDTPTRNLERT